MVPSKLEKCEQSIATCKSKYEQMANIKDVPQVVSESSFLSWNMLLKFIPAMNETVERK